MEKISSAAFTDTKPHYDLLEGMRGDAALKQIRYQENEGNPFANTSKKETKNHS